MPLPICYHKTMTVHIADETALQAWVATKLAPAILRVGKPVTVALEGTLGAGKTALARSLIRTLTGNSALEVPSPTYTLLQTYPTPYGEIYHFDLYRLQHPDETMELGWEEAMTGFLTLVEWPDRLGYLRPPYLITLAIAPVSGSDTARQLTLTGLDLTA